MSRMTNTLCASIAGASMFAALIPGAYAQMGDPVKGREVAEASCNNCHVTERTRVDRIYRKMDTGGAPDFLVIALDPDVDVEHLTRFLKLPHASNVLLPSEQIPDVISYILTLRPLPKGPPSGTSTTTGKKE